MKINAKLFNITTVIPRTWQLLGETEKCCQNRVLPKPDSEKKIDKNSRTNFIA